MVERVSGGYLVTGASVDVLRASNFFDLLKGYDGILASLEPKPLNDAQTGLRPMIAARDAEQAPDHAVSGSEAEMPNAPFVQVETSKVAFDRASLKMMSAYKILRRESPKKPHADIGWMQDLLSVGLDALRVGGDRQ